MKYIKIRITAFRKSGLKYGHIIEQTHRGKEFSISKKGELSNSFEASNSFKLWSCHYPESYIPQDLKDFTEARKRDISLGILLVRGNITGYDDIPFPIPSEEWLSDLRIAIKEYNTMFRDDDVNQNVLPLITYID